MKLKGTQGFVLSCYEMQGGAYKTLHNPGFSHFPTDRRKVILKKTSPTRKEAVGKILDLTKHPKIKQR